MKKHLSLVVILFGMFISVFAQEPETGRIVFYREQNFQGSAVSIPVYVNHKQVVKLKNNSYFEYDCIPGDYAFSLNRKGEAPLTLRVEAGETYYLRLGFRMSFWSSVPEMLLVEGASAVPAISSGQMRQITPEMLNLTRPSNRIGINLAAGFGFKNHPFFEIEGGGKSKISLGGGVAIGLKYGREFGKHFDLSSELNYQFSNLRPPITNGDVTFSRGILSVTPSYIIPIREGDEMRVKLGAGLDYYWSNRLKIESSSIPGGFNDIWTYQNALGPHFNAILEMNLSDKASFIYGLKFYHVGYTFNSAERFTPEEVSFPELRETSGAGMDMLLGFFLYF
ncbi:MAG: DUF2846 domain-containing protein [Bacteroides sp.]|nr:DUF2846 domain-containing protein [Bacteroides sp.]